MMKLIRSTFTFTTALLLIFFISNNVATSPGVSVEKISESALDELLYSHDNKMVVTFLAAWCDPCIDELPSLNKLYAKYKSRGLKLIGISIDLEGPPVMQPVVDKLKVGFPVYWYGESAIKKFSIYAIPMIIWINDGKIVEKLSGRRSEKELDKKIRKFLDL